MRPDEPSEADRPGSDRLESDRPEAGIDAGDNPTGAPSRRVEDLVQPEDVTSYNVIAPFPS